jgi:hypothetical protein
MVFNLRIFEHSINFLNCGLAFDPPHFWKNFTTGAVAISSLIFIKCNLMSIKCFMNEQVNLSQIMPRKAG